VLDEAMADLEETDREALLMRYFQNYDLRTVGAALGVSDDAAQKRVSRALEKLRESFLRRELTTATGTLAVIISTNAVLAAPAGLATSISTAAALAGMSVIPAAVIATKTIAMTTLQKALVGTTVAVLAGAGIYEARQAAQLGERVRTLQQQQAPLAARIREMEGASDEAGRQLAALREENERLKSLSAERLKLSGEVAKLRNQASEAAQEIRTLRQAPEAKSPAEEAPAHFAKESWAFAGYATPEAALQSVAWAQSKGSLETFLAGLGTEARAEVLSALKRKPELEASLFSEINKVKSFTILKKVPLAEDQMLFRVRNELEDGTAKVTVTTLKRTEGEWKVQSGRAE
jgi:hypothetical protein